MNLPGQDEMKADAILREASDYIERVMGDKTKAYVEMDPGPFMEEIKDFIRRARKALRSSQ